MDDNQKTNGDREMDGKGRPQGKCLNVLLNLTASLRGFPEVQCQDHLLVGRPPEFNMHHLDFECLISTKETKVREEIYALWYIRSMEGSDQELRAYIHV